MLNFGGVPLKVQQKGGKQKKTKSPSSWGSVHVPLTNRLFVLFLLFSVGKKWRDWPIIKKKSIERQWSAFWWSKLGMWIKMWWVFFRSKCWKANEGFSRCRGRSFTLFGCLVKFVWQIQNIFLSLSKFQISPSCSEFHSIQIKICMSNDQSRYHIDLNTQSLSGT